MSSRLLLPRARRYKFYQANLWGRVFLTKSLGKKKFYFRDLIGV